MQVHRQSKITQTPPILIVDGVWVDILYTLDEFKIDRAGHQRQIRQAQERVILAAIAVWSDGSYQLLILLANLTKKGKGEVYLRIRFTKINLSNAFSDRKRSFSMHSDRQRHDKNPEKFCVTLGIRL